LKIKEKEVEELIIDVIKKKIVRDRMDKDERKV
jgi:hypothetical protein